MIVVGGEQSPALGNEAKHVEETRARLGKSYALGALSRGAKDRNVLELVDAKILERPTALEEVEHLMAPEAPSRLPLEQGHGGRQLDEAVGIGVRQRSEYDRVEQSEDGSGGADPQRERDERDEREGWGAPKRTKGLPRLAAQGVAGRHVLCP